MLGWDSGPRVEGPGVIPRPQPIPSGKGPVRRVDLLKVITFMEAGGLRAVMRRRMEGRREAYRENFLQWMGRDLPASAAAELHYRLWVRQMDRAMRLADLLDGRGVVCRKAPGVVVSGPNGTVRLSEADFAVWREAESPNLEGEI